MLNWPLGDRIRIGDFFTLSAGSFNVVGNIYESYFQLDITDEFARDIYRFSAPVLEPFVEANTAWEIFTPKKHIWQLSGGSSTDYESKQMLHPFKRKLSPPDVNKYVVSLNKAGSYFFNATDVQYVRMPHFKEIHKEVIRRLSTEFFNYNKIFLVTEVAHTRDFSAGISRMDDGCLVMSLDEFFNGGVLELLSSNFPITVEKTQGLEFLKLREEGGAIAFKAMKMDLSLKAREMLIREIHRSSEKDMKKYAVELIDHDLFHLFPSIEINPGNANDFFEWTQMTLDDLELFLGKSADQ